MIRIPETNGTARDNILHDEVVRRIGRPPIEWSAIQCSNDKHTGILYVTSDSISVRAKWNSTETCDCGKHQGVLYVPDGAVDVQQCTEICRINVTPTLAQHICDMTGTLLPTTKISDMLYEQRSIKLPPYTSSPDSQMAWTSRMVWHSNKIDLGKGNATGLVCNVGKHWVFTNTLLQHPGMAANYGWYDSSAPYKSANGKYNLWQPLSWAHNLQHEDYSQILVLIGSEMIVDGETTNTWDVLKDAELCSMLSYEGVLTIDRIPGVDPDPDSGCDLISPRAST